MVFEASSSTCKTRSQRRMAPTLLFQIMMVFSCLWPTASVVGSKAPFLPRPLEFWGHQASSGHSIPFWGIRGGANGPKGTFQTSDHIPAASRDDRPRSPRQDRSGDEIDHNAKHFDHQSSKTSASPSVQGVQANSIPSNPPGHGVRWRRLPPA